MLKLLEQTKGGVVVGVLMVSAWMYKNSMSRKKSSVLLEVDRSIIENNLLIQVRLIKITPM
jgi:hypothetical protein